MNILLTSAGRRGYLVKYFKAALEGNGEVHVANSSKYCPAFTYADYTVITPLIYDKEYINFLKKYCIEKEIDAIISLFDIDLLVLAEHKEEFENIGVTIVVSSVEVVETCNDKWNTYIFLKKAGFYTPRTYLNLEEALKNIEQKKLHYPLILKPRWGMGSIAIYTADNEEELNAFYNKINNQIKESYLKYESIRTPKNTVLIQEMLYGQEYGIDVINDLKGNYQTTIVKKKYAMRAGETDCAMTVQEAKLERCGENLSKALRHIGNLDIDVFYDGNKPFVLEMNARFGGGYPFSHIAGADLPKAIVAWLKNEECKKEWLEVEYSVIAHKDIKITQL